MKTVIGWTYIFNQGSSIFFEPISLAAFQKIRSDLVNGVGACPAVKVFENRVILVRSPYTFRLRASENSGNWSFQPVFPQTEVQESVLRSLIEFQPIRQWRSERCPILQLSLPYVFFSDANACLNQIESPQISANKNWSLIQGRFNIYDWQRPVNWSVEWLDTSSDLIIKRGQPLFSLLVETESPDNLVELKYVEMYKELEQVIQSNSGVSKVMHGTFSLLKDARKKRPATLIK